MGLNILNKAKNYLQHMRHKDVKSDVLPKKELVKKVVAKHPQSKSAKKKNVHQQANHAVHLKKHVQKQAPKQSSNTVPKQPPKQSVKQFSANKEIDDVIQELAGKDVIPLVRVLRNKANVSEFKIAEVLKIEVNVVRNMLYRLYNVSLVSFTRKKDKKKGWYIYYWTFNPGRLPELTKSLKQRNLERFQERLAREKSSHFFLCPTKCMRLDFEQATDFEYKCPECGKLLEQEDNAPKIQQIEQEIAHLQKDLGKNS